MTIKTLSADDTAYTLRQALGPLRVWGRFLSDAITTRASFKGLTLPPCCQRHDGRSFRPRYDPAEVLEFIKAVRLSVPTTSGSTIEAIGLDVKPGLPWRGNRFDKDGNRMHRIASTIAH